MPINHRYYIGIGGTGARALESLVHLCAAGLGPDKITAVLVDPDGGNGNLDRTRELIKKYQKVREEINPKEQTGFFHTDLNFSGEWRIVTSDNLGQCTLKNHINFTALGQMQRDMANLLFSPEELDQTLDQGFRGHPSIGATVLAMQDMSDVKALRDLFSNHHDANSGQIGVFVCGSVFGGTGAAGIPVFGSPEMLKYHDVFRINGKDSRIVLGAAMILPYFQVSAPGDGKDQKEKGLFVESADFSIATRAALQFYASRKELSFDRCYLLGDKPSDKKPEFAPGDNAQKNDAHCVELIAAVGALDFWENAESQKETQYFTSAKGSTSEIDPKTSWDNLPSSSVPQKNSEIVFKGLMNMGLFSTIFGTYGNALCSISDLNSRQAKMCRMLPWFRESGMKVYANNGSHIKSLLEFGSLFLAWQDQVEKTSQVELLKFDIGDHREKSSDGRTMGTSAEGLRVSYIDNSADFPFPVWRPEKTPGWRWAIRDSVPKGTTWWDYFSTHCLLENPKDSVTNQRNGKSSQVTDSRTGQEIAAREMALRLAAHFENAIGRFVDRTFSMETGTAGK